MAAALTRFAGPNDSQLTDGMAQRHVLRAVRRGDRHRGPGRARGGRIHLRDPIPAGEFLYRDADRDLEVWLPYHVADDWQFLRGTESWEGLAASRRQRRQAGPQIDARGRALRASRTVRGRRVPGARAGVCRGRG